MPLAAKSPRGFFSRSREHSGRGACFCGCELLCARTISPSWAWMFVLRTWIDFRTCRTAVSTQCFHRRAAGLTEKRYVLRKSLLISNACFGALLPPLPSTDWYLTSFAWFSSKWPMDRVDPLLPGSRSFTTHTRARLVGA